MSIKERLQRWLGINAPPPIPVAAARRGIDIRPEVAAKLRQMTRAKDIAAPRAVAIELPALAPGVVPEGQGLALDDAFLPMRQYGALNAGFLSFPGYPHLATIAQRSEYRSPSETMSTEMTRNWIRLTSTSKDKGNADILQELNTEMVTFDIKEHLRRIALIDGLFGRAQLYVRIKGQEDDASRKLPLLIDEKTIVKGSLLGFTVIEPMWTAPLNYNSSDPTQPDFYKPKEWYIFGKATHADRLLTFISREVPDMFKPAYNFSGISLSQLMEEYVNLWLRTRNSVNDMLHSFSISGIATDLSSTLAGGDGEDLLQRAQLFVEGRDNQDLMLINKDSEEFFQFNVPLSGLDSLQAQAQEHMAAPSHVPLVKLTGVTPSGLNASSEGEISVFYDHVKAMQGQVFTKHLTTILNILQLNKYGKIDPTIGFEYVELRDLDGESLARVRKADADAGVAYVTACILDPIEERKRLAADPASGYAGIDAEDVPEPPEMPTAEEGAASTAQAA